MEVSIVIPTYKRAKRLTKAIDSVLMQNYSGPMEIIVVDDNGDNSFRKETYILLKPYIDSNKIIYLQHNENQGGCQARNTGAFIAKGTYLTFLDDDDFYEPNKIKEQVAVLLNNIELDACACAMFRIDEDGKQIISKENYPRGTHLKEAILNGNLFTGMLMIKSTVFRELNGFSEIPRFQDKYFHYKFLENGFKLGLLQTQLCTLLEHKSDRISSTNANKVLYALDRLHEFEKQHKIQFSKQEWKCLKHRINYVKAYHLANGTLKDKTKVLFYLMKSLGYKVNVFDTLKLGLRTIVPNFILKR